MTSIQLELIIQEPIYLELAIQETISINPIAAQEPVFSMWETINFLSGEKKSGVHAGRLWQMSLSDDYLYVCVKAGEIGVAIWKKTLLFQT